MSWFDDPPVEQPADQPAAPAATVVVANEPDLDQPPIHAYPDETTPPANGQHRNGRGRAKPAPKIDDRVPPHDLETERALLGAAMIGAAHALEDLPDDLWYGGGHLHVAEAIRQVANDQGRADVGLVVAWLQEHGLLELIGGTPALAPIVGAAGWTASADRYVEILEGYRQARAYVRATDAALRAAYEGRVDDARQHLAHLDTTLRVRELEHRALTDTFEHPPARPDVIVEGLISAGEMTALAAPRALGKSWLSMQLAILAARGEGKVAGVLDVRTPVNVLYCHGELDPHGAYMRWHRMTLGQPPDGVYETFDRWRIRTVERRAPAPGGGTDTHIEGLLDPRLEQLVVDRNIGLLIIDPWAVYFAGKENSNDETEAALDKLRDLSLRHGTAILVVHHISAKIEVGRLAEPEDLWRGATRLADWASTRVTMLRHFTDKEVAERQMTRQDARRFVDVKLLRRGEPTPDFSMRMDFGTGWWEAWNPPGRPEGSVDPAKNPDSQRIAEQCATAGGWPSLRAAAASLGVGTEKASQLLQRAVLDGQLEAIPGPGKRIRYLPTVEPIQAQEGTLDELLDDTDPGPTEPPPHPDEDQP